MAQRYYFDTSVFGGVFDAEFEEETLQLFEKVAFGEIVCVYSDLTEKELSGAPQKVKDYFGQLNQKHIEIVEVSEEAFALAQTYVDEKVVGPTSFDDCVHIATATLNKVDILVSWNFKHIVNILESGATIRSTCASGTGHLKYVHQKKLLDMKTKDKTEKAFDTLKTFRDIKEKISKDTYGMTYEQFKAYLAQKEAKPQS